MTTPLRLSRSSLVCQLWSRGLSTEPAISAVKPIKTAVKTQENDPTNHTKEDLAKFYTMPNEVRKRIFPSYCLPVYFERFCETFCETSLLIRQPALELIDFLKRADYNKPIIRYALYGRFGSGKTLTLVHALNYAANNDFIIVHIPKVWKWYHWSREVVPAERDASLFDLPVDAGIWLKDFSIINSDLITKLDLKTSKTYEWSAREKTEEGSSLNEIVLLGINRVKFACQVIDVLLNELKTYARNDRCKVFIGIDGYNGFFQTSSRLRTSERVRFIPTNASLSKSFIEFIKNDWNNGAAVLIIDDHACTKDAFPTTHFPFHLLKKVGVESIDPFIPINVPHYTPVEFQNYLDYLEEKRWLQRPEGRDEIEFVTQRNPREITTYCATR